MWNDEIVDEVRRSREAHAERCGNNLKSIVADLQHQQSVGGRTIVSFIPQNNSQENDDSQEYENNQNKFSIVET